MALLKELFIKWSKQLTLNSSKQLGKLHLTIYIPYKSISDEFKLTLLFLLI